MSNKTPQRSPLWRVSQIISWLGSTLVFDLKIFGKRNIPKHGGVLLLSNHQSYLDPVLLSVKIDRPVSFMAKSELFEKSPFFTWLIRSHHAFPVRRGQSDVGAMKQAIALLQEGHILNMYPEGTRSTTGKIGPILPGVAVVVRRAGVPVIPVVIDGAVRAWPKGAKLPRKTPIRILYGKPMNFDGLKGDQIVALIGDTLHGMQTELQTSKRYCGNDHRAGT